MHTRSYVFGRILTLLLTHEVAFSRCDLLKTKSPNRLVEPNANGYQRLARQTPIDLSRMYLPPIIDAFASSGFGAQAVDASNNFGDNVNAGYGEIIGLDQSGAFGSTYESSTKATDDLVVRTSAGPYGGTAGRSEGYQSTAAGYLATSEGNSFERDSNKNDGYNDPSTSSARIANSHAAAGDSSGTKSTPARTESANGYGSPSELLDTAQSQGISQSSYNNKLTESRTSGQNAAGVREPPQKSSGNSEQNLYSSGENRQFSGSGDQKPTSNDNAAAGYSYDRPSVGFDDFFTRNFNNQNENYGQYYGRAPDTQRFQTAGEFYGRGAISTVNYRQGTLSSPRPYGQNVNEKPAANPQNTYKDSNSPFGGTTYDSYGLQSSPENNDRFNQKNSPNYESGLNLNSNGYGTNDVGGLNSLNREKSITNDQQSGANRDVAATRLPERNGYAQTREKYDLPTTTGAGQNSGQRSFGSSSSYGRGRIGSCAMLCSKIIGRNGVSSSASMTGSSAIPGSGDRSNKKIHSTLVPEGQYQNSNLPSRGDSKKPGKESHDYYGKPSANAFSNFAPGSVPNQPPVNNDQPGANAFSNFAPVSLPNQPPQNNDQPGANAFSNFAPDSLPNQPPENNDQPGANSFSNFAPGNLPNQLPENNDQPGANSFSNFAPGNLPNLPQINNDQPGANAFSNFAPDSVPNQPPENNDQPGANSFSNFAPGNLPNLPQVNNDQPGANAFSNFAPGSLPNQPPENNNRPGVNSFSNFAPGNQPNQPPPANSASSNDCSKISDHINNANKQTEAVFSNIGY